jgi:hypothetical protein
VIIPDALKPADTAWKPYKNPQVITAENAKSITSFDKSDVESMVTYFYASKIRGDDDWKKVLEPENTWSKRMLYSLDKCEKWTFTAFRLDRKRCMLKTGGGSMSILRLKSAARLTVALTRFQ